MSSGAVKACARSRRGGGGKAGCALGDELAIGDEGGAARGAEADAGERAAGEIEAEGGHIALGVAAGGALDAQRRRAVAPEAALEQFADGEARRHAAAGFAAGR